MAELSDIERSFDEIKNKSRASTPNPWLDRNFSRVDPWGKEPGIRVDDIPERLGLLKQAQDLGLWGNYFVDLRDTPSNYGKNGQFVKTDGVGKLSFAWPYWVKAGSTIYYKKGDVAVGLSTPLARFHTYGDNILDGAVTINESGRDKDFRVEGDTELNLLFCDASTDRFAVGTNAPLCRMHIRGVVCADYAGLNPDTILLIENDDNVVLQMQAATNGEARIVFADDQYNPPAGRIMYKFADDEMVFCVGTNDIVVVGADGTHSRITSSHRGIKIDSPSYAVFIADAHNSNAYIEFQEDSVLKWTAGFNYSDSLKFQICEGVSGTNVRFEIEPGVAGLINLYQDVGIRNSQDLRFYNNGNYVGFKSPALSADQIWTLPTADGSQAGSPLVSNASGTLSWAGRVDLGAGNFVTTGTLGAGQTTLVDATIGDDARGLSSIFTLSANPAKSDGIALYAEGHIGAITTDGPTYGGGIWLNIDNGVTLGADVRALDIGIYERGADCSGGNAYGLAIHMDFDSTNPPAAIYPLRLNCEVSGATPTALIFAPNKEALGLVIGDPGTADDAYLKIVLQDGSVYRIPLVKE